MELSILWFILIAVLWTGYLVLEGFDFGVGMLLPVLGKSERERRAVINTIGPVWDGNEVWLLTAGGATFAAFPEWYASMFSGFYLPLLFILFALIFRGMAFEYRSKIETPRWKAWCDFGIIFGSWTPAILWGVAFANLVRGVELNDNYDFVGSFFSLLSPYALLGGAVTLLLFLAHGALFLALKTDGKMRVDANRLASRFLAGAILAGGVWVVWTQLGYGAGWTWIATGGAAAGLVLAWLFNKVGHEGRAFAASAAAILAAVVLIFGSLYPNVMPDINGINNLTIENASSTDYTLTIMTWVAVLLTPIVLLYQGWTFWVFRKRIKVEHIPDPIGLPSLRVPRDTPGAPAPNSTDKA
ncbi:cytochrome d ubiquinol oxidase subunit II [Jonesia denitrificans]|uniref:Cytochrome d ubiquinol oxidase, subunit II n=1 Tax=Jonesia denitrificans (strain ATCC 14870 / DSM 20603 / BCRC 15368 / CIP 55.134 / JCM 11481 / NBRC 15587 / NCTC 10816 / Prevot 55134) TaxID=471856 RepID=C7QYR4_JONDD|nr:cytochrome d ubiquinol oxidase subunit II [Jonesia denitrificans]ACV09303.1 cytochrome d ubiquinol oxidase, subunit II [Jonesia denitrificans DSM 20603]ASE09440.1 cytochrome d ubiquinol oxidase subunit II [Jonesia denitrificans]QXB43986.1 cytochrome d ubiquinol oxidase subunit II [Jonesia denitrificans]SQH21558.1 Cytochrome d ubiquinol oxidase subunit 2 [Jonesia denitrificans]